MSQENEQLQFAARGQVQTDDGRTIAFDLAFQIQRSSVEEQHFEFKAGDALIDPLVLNFDGAAVQLAEGTFAFDLQADGKTESLPLPGTGSFFLAIDRNQDGKVNDGSELFGPTTGDGFSELAQYDADQNGWIDEGDAVYRDLRLWQPNAEDSGQLTTLTDKVGAIYLQSASTPFTYQDTAGQTEATTSESGVFLQEDGTPGTIQELNYVV